MTEGSIFMFTDSFRNRKNGFETMGSSTDGGKNSRSSGNGAAFKIAALIIGVIIIAFLAFNSAYQIREQEEAVLITLGKAQAVTDPGLHFKIPFIQQVRKVNTTIQGFAIGYSTDSNETQETESDHDKEISGREKVYEEKNVCTGQNTRS